MLEFQAGNRERTTVWDVGNTLYLKGLAQSFLWLKFYTVYAHASFGTISPDIITSYILSIYEVYFLGGSVVKNLLANAQDKRRGFNLWIGKIPWSWKCSNILAWRILPGGLQSVGLQRVRHDWAHVLSHMWSTPEHSGILYNLMDLHKLSITVVYCLFSYVKVNKFTSESLFPFINFLSKWYATAFLKLS